ncbi:vWA domain-containing protein [Cyclobacterium xiamenense]|uniref:vWA domain-containing protein n=1 Tax=Cyclobacterium xiamenense TaxID=1297121 RepID=UPI0012B9EF1E|nr:vWA domain-containing protein [Cyclobacterium xiamenense]
MRNATKGLVKTGCSLLILLAFAACQDLTENQQEAVTLTQNTADDLSTNEFEGDLPTSLVPLKDYSKKYSEQLRLSTASTESSLESPIEATLMPEESHTQTLTGKINGAPSTGDVMFMLDVSGSMGRVLNTAKANSINIMNAVRGLIPDTNFGAISQVDYSGPFAGCGYSSTYGASTDFPYQLNANLSSDLSSTATGINSMVLGNGMDIAESYTRALWELYNDESINWRPGSKKIAIYWLDAIPHDCNVYGLVGLNGISRGPDPGRDNTAGTADDLEFVKTINELKDNGYTLITLFSGPTSGDAFNLWRTASQITGGDAFPFDSSSPDVAEFIANIIAENLNKIDNLSIETCDPVYAPWLTAVSPGSHTGIVLDEPVERLFDVTVTVPEGTAPGVYTFDLCLVGDGATYGTTSVTITVPEPVVPVAFDVHPGSCPNPIQLRRNGVIPTAILGTADFDVNEIDLSTLTMEGVSPVRHAYSDVATPYLPLADKPLDSGACNELGSDGFMDLTLKFDAQEIIQTLGDVSRDDLIKVKVMGKLLDGTDFEGEDIIIIR